MRPSPSEHLLLLTHSHVLETTDNTSLLGVAEGEEQVDISSAGHNDPRSTSGLGIGRHVGSWAIIPCRCKQNGDAIEIERISLHSREIIKDGSAADGVFKWEDWTAAGKIGCTRRELDGAAGDGVKVSSVEAVICFDQVDRYRNVFAVRYLVSYVKGTSVDHFGSTHSNGWRSEESAKDAEWDKKIHVGDFCWGELYGLLLIV